MKFDRSLTSTTTNKHMGINYQQKLNPLIGIPTTTVPQALASQLGQGLAFPLVCINDNWQTLAGITDVEQSMFITITTPVGCHFMNPDFGSLLPRYLFEAYDQVTQIGVYDTVSNALKAWVPQIIVQSVSLDSTQIQNNQLTIVVNYIVKGTLSSQSLTIVYTTPDVVQYGPGAFTIGGRSVFAT